ncbi:type I methionyl aminopeptidase [Brachyspira hyodysenteriae]|uniref:type I methionyl aminopeptidase n=1 Tax=Brachyspira hyodysenteriae TaxID=159 RepID=UPI0022CD92D5|nr:type I methionyl aminopeptidase [Brachyspira hyodysenteriae]MCZ9926715.1 type I methionyl aminopeptidase [Brachyspira hyodysenteriae]
MAIKIKTQAEINLMRESGHILANVFKEVEKIVQPGISTKEIDKFVYDYIRKHNAKPSFKGYGNPPFPGSICSSINNEVIHGIPSKKKILKDGDIIGLDIGVYYKGYHSDRAFTFKVGNVSEEASRLVEVTMQSFFNGVKKIKDGVHLGDVSHAIQKTAEDAGYSFVREFQGHGVGANLHEEPAVPNRGKEGAGPILKTNMVIAIEPMVNMGHHAILIEDDDWTIITRDGSLSAHYEHTVAVKEDGVEILTALEDDEIVNKYLGK